MGENVFMEDVGRIPAESVLRTLVEDGRINEGVEDAEDLVEEDWRGVED